MNKEAQEVRNIIRDVYNSDISYVDENMLRILYGVGDAKENGK